MSNKDYRNQLNKERRERAKKAILEQNQDEANRTIQETLESNRRAINSYYGGVNPND